MIVEIDVAPQRMKRCEQRKRISGRAAQRVAAKHTMLFQPQVEDERFRTTSIVAENEGLDNHKHQTAKNPGAVADFGHSVRSKDFSTQSRTDR